MAEPVLCGYRYGTRAIRDISQVPGGQVAISIPYSAHSWNSKTAETKNSNPFRKDLTPVLCRIDVVFMDADYA